ncbi:MAG: hypothetical protein IKX90_03515, partial [Verrucomicrobia bacterium]|nr:hypothetical protein [Verrucomicrobiota bacterium]
IKIQNAAHVSVRLTSFLSLFGESVDIKLKTLKVSKIIKNQFLILFFGRVESPGYAVDYFPRWFILCAKEEGPAGGPS